MAKERRMTIRSKDVHTNFPHGAGEVKTHGGNFEHYTNTLVEVYKALPTHLENFLNNPTHTPSKTSEEVKILNYLPNLVFFHPDAHILRPIYQLLNNRIQNENTPLEQKFAATFIADIFFHQSAPGNLADKYIYQDVSNAKAHIIQDTTYVLTPLREQHPPSKETRETKKNLFRNVEDFVKQQENLVSNITTLDQAKKQVDCINGYEMLRGGVLETYWNTMGSETLKKRFNSLKKSLHTEFAAALLINRKLSDIFPPLRYFIWGNAQEQIILFGDNKERQTQLTKYFLSDPDIQNIFWTQLFETKNISALPTVHEKYNDTDIRHLPESYLYVEKFFLEDSDTIRSFLQTTQLQTAPKARREVILRKLIGATALFQTLYFDKENAAPHPNAEYIRTFLQTLAREAKSEGTIVDSLTILADEKPGAIYLRPSQEGRAGQAKTEKGTSVVYISKAKQESKSPTNEKLNPLVTTTHEKTAYLRIPAGDRVTVTSWHELRQPQSEKIPTVLNHLAERFTWDETYLEAALKRIERHHVESSPYDRAIVLPVLTKDVQPFAALHEVGIIAVQRETGLQTTYSFLIDPAKANLAFEGRLLVIQGSLHDNLFIPSAVDNDFLLSPFHVALTEAALLTHKNYDDFSISGKSEKRLHNAKHHVVEWNRSAKASQFPLIEPVPPLSTADIVVVIPLDQDKNVTHWSLRS